jgi:hypothetical protein
MNRRQSFLRNSGYFIISALLLAGCSNKLDIGGNENGRVQIIRR